VEEGHTRLARHRARQQRLATARRTKQQDPLRNLGAQRLILARVFEVVDDFRQLLLGFVHSCHIVKGHTGDALVIAASACLAKREGLIIARLCRAHQQHIEHRTQNQEHEKCANHLPQIVGHAAVFRELDPHIGFGHQLVELVARFALWRQGGIEAGTILKHTGQARTLHRDLGDGAVLHLTHQICVAQFSHAGGLQGG
jgi:hypothetical protein